MRSLHPPPLGCTHPHPLPSTQEFHKRVGGGWPWIPEVLSIHHPPALEVLSANGCFPSRVLFFLKHNNLNNNFEIILKHSNDIRCQLKGEKSEGKKARDCSDQDKDVQVAGGGGRAPRLLMRSLCESIPGVPLSGNHKPRPPAARFRETEIKVFNPWLTGAVGGDISSSWKW